MQICPLDLLIWHYVQVNGSVFIIETRLSNPDSTINQCLCFPPIVQFTVPRMSSLSGSKLPSARDVSLGVHTNVGGSTLFSPHLSMAVMQMGQFIDHDIIATPIEEGKTFKTAWL